MYVELREVRMETGDGTSPRKRVKARQKIEGLENWREDSDLYVKAYMIDLAKPKQKQGRLSGDT